MNSNNNYSDDTPAWDTVSRESIYSKKLNVKSYFRLNDLKLNKLLNADHLKSCGSNQASVTPAAAAVAGSLKLLNLKTINNKFNLKLKLNSFSHLNSKYYFIEIDKSYDYELCKPGDKIVEINGRLVMDYTIEEIYKFIHNTNDIDTLMIEQQYFNNEAASTNKNDSFNLILSSSSSASSIQASPLFTTSTIDSNNNTSTNHRIMRSSNSQQQQQQQQPSTGASILDSFVTRTIIDNNNDDLIKGRTRNCCLEIEKEVVDAAAATPTVVTVARKQFKFPPPPSIIITNSTTTPLVKPTRIKSIKLPPTPPNPQQQHHKRKRSRSLPPYFNIDWLLEFYTTTIKKPSFLAKPSIVSTKQCVNSSSSSNNKSIVNNYLSCNLPLLTARFQKPSESEKTSEFEHIAALVEELNVNNNCNNESSVNLLKKAPTQPTLLIDATEAAATPVAVPSTMGCINTARIDIRRARSFRDLSQIHQQQVYRVDDLIFNEKIGEGFFAIVTKITHRRTGQVMVLKELKLDLYEQQQANDAGGVDLNENNQAIKSFLKEAQVLRNLKHPNIIKFLGVLFTKDRRLNLILEYVSGGTLKDIIHNLNISLTWKLRVGYAKDIAAGMEYLHSLNIIHRDLKSDNCLVRENGTVVVADFGLSRVIEDETLFNTAESTPQPAQQATTTTPTTTCEGTSLIAAVKRKLRRRVDRKQRYAVVGNSFSMAPEMLKHQVYDERVDIFSFGIICCEIIGRVQADPDYLPRTSDFGLNVELFRKKYCETDCPKHFIRIAIACCELEPEQRPPFTKSHPWLETILLHLETNNPIPKNLFKNIVDQKR